MTQSDRANERVCKPPARDPTGHFTIAIDRFAAEQRLITGNGKCRQFFLQRCRTLCVHRLSTDEIGFVLIHSEAQASFQQ